MQEKELIFSGPEIRWDWKTLDCLFGSDHKEQHNHYDTVSALLQFYIKHFCQFFCQPVAAYPPPKVTTLSGERVLTH